MNRPYCVAYAFEMSIFFIEALGTAFRVVAVRVNKTVSVFPVESDFPRLFCIVASPNAVRTAGRTTVHAIPRENVFQITRPIEIGFGIRDSSSANVRIFFFTIYLTFPWRNFRGIFFGKFWFYGVFRWALPFGLRLKTNLFARFDDGRIRGSRNFMTASTKPYNSIYVLKYFISNIDTYISW